MLNDELLAFIDEQARFLAHNNKHSAADAEKQLYASAMKLNEEVGELNEAILAHHGRQRRSKTAGTNDIAAELADVIIVSLIIANHLDLDVNEALRAKIQRVIERRASG